MAADKWYDDARLTRAFCNALIEAGYLESNEEIREFNKKPQKFDDEYDAWAEAGFPDDANEDGWTEFVEAISTEEESE